MSEKNQTTSIEFICPKCNGSYFGSYELPDKSRQYYCQGDSSGCHANFSWHEKDMWRHKWIITKTGFSSDEEYQKAYKGIS